jgi:hypothetical protein
MKRIVTSYGDFRTGDELADAVGRYGLALARAHLTDSVEFPYLTALGQTDRVEMRIGWLVDIGVVRDNGASGNMEIIEPDSAQEMRRRADALDDRLAGWSSHPEASWLFWEHYL